MRLNWLTSTTALALVLNSAAPVSAASTGAVTPHADRVGTAKGAQLAQADQAQDGSLLKDIAPDLADGLSDAANEAEKPANPVTQQLEDATSGAAGADPDAQAGDAAAAEQKAADDAAAEQKAAEEAANAAAEQKAAEEAARVEAEQKAAEEAARVEAEQKAAEESAVEAERKAAEEAAEEAEQKAAEAEKAAQEAEQKAADDAAAAEAEAQATKDAQAAEAQAAEAQADAEAEASPEPEKEQPQADQAASDADDAGQVDREAQEGTADAAPEADPTMDLTAEDGPVPADQTDSDSAPDTAEAPEVTAEEQADALAEEATDAPAAAAASGEGEVVETEEGTVTEEQARASDEEFQTTASGQQIPAQAAPVGKKKDNDLLKAVGIVAAAGLGAYAVGKLLDNGGEVVSNTGDRAVVREPNGQYRIIKDDDTLLRRPGSNVSTQTYSDGSTRTEVVARDNSSTVTIRAADGRVLRRTRILPDGREVVLFDDTKEFARVDVSDLEPDRARDYDYSRADVDSLRAALSAKNEALPDRTFSLNQVRRIDAVRHLVPVIALDAINFRTGSAVIEPNEAQDLSDLGRAMRDAIDEDPGQVFLIEGHTDTVGDASYNLALSDRRAESVALALTEYFDVPPSNMIVQGYGESDLRVRRSGDIRENRRGAVRNITPLLTARR